MNNEMVIITVSQLDAFQLVGGLTARAESWENTARYLESDGADYDDSLIIEECNSADEARKVAENYRDLIRTIEIAQQVPVTLEPLPKLLDMIDDKLEAILDDDDNQCSSAVGEQIETIQQFIYRSRRAVPVKKTRK